MVEEYKSIMKNDVWEIVPRLEDKSMVNSRWLYKVKHLVHYNTNKYKVQFIARGLSQREGVKHEETFAPNARYTSIETIIYVVNLDI
jgi:hypothetical protein